MPGQLWAHLPQSPAAGSHAANVGWRLQCMIAVVVPSFKRVDRGSGCTHPDPIMTRWTEAASSIAGSICRKFQVCAGILHINKQDFPPTQQAHGIADCAKSSNLLREILVDYDQTNRYVGVHAGRTLQTETKISGRLELDYICLQH